MDYSGTDKHEMPTSQLASFGLVGKGTYDFEPMTDLDNPVVFKTAFTLDPITNFPGPGAMWMPVGLAPGRIEDLRQQSPRSPQAHPYVCNSYSYEERYELVFPETVTVRHLPDTVEFSEQGHTYRATYSLIDNTVHLTRSLVVDRPSDVCQPGDELAYNRLLEAIQNDLRGQILYVPSED